MRASNNGADTRPKVESPDAMAADADALAGGASLLFAQRNRPDLDPKRRVETEWEYLDRSGRAQASRVRALMERWIVEYPAAERTELITRLRGKDHQFQSAAFELVVFALLRSIGCSVVVHPTLPNGTDRHPDFLARTSLGESVYVEAVVASEFSDEEGAAHRRADVLLNTIDARVDSQRFLLWVETDGSPATPPSGRRLARDVQAWLNSLDPDEVAEQLREGGAQQALPSMRWEHDGWRVVLRAFPRQSENHPEGHRPIGALSGAMEFVDDWTPIRDAICQKGGRYGELELPFLVCVNAETAGVDEIDETQALFGEETFTFSRRDLSRPPILSRRPNGAWIGPGGPQYTRVSGAWIFRALSPWNLATRISTLYFNPMAARPLSAFFQDVDHVLVTDGVADRRRVRSVADVLGLPEGWPD